MSEFTIETLVALVDEREAAFQACDLGEMKSVNRSVKASRALKDACMDTTRLALALHAELEQSLKVTTELVSQWYEDAHALDVDQNNPQLSERINTLRECADELRVALSVLTGTQETK